MKITCKEDLKNVILHIGDDVVFNETVFEVEENEVGVYLSSSSSSYVHRESIEDLKIDLDTIAIRTLRDSYAEGGIWPYAKHDDFEGLTRLVRAVYIELGK